MERLDGALHGDLFLERWMGADLEKTLLRFSHQVWIVGDNPGSEILGALPAWLWLHPQFKVLDPVVVANAVDVVDVLVRLELAAEMRFHDEAVLGYLFLAVVAPNQDVAVFVPVATLRDDASDGAEMAPFG
jgi:hypothetical protein